MPDERNPSLLRYAGLATELLAGLGIGVYAGIWLDKKLTLSTPVMAWLLPLIILAAILTKLIRDTSKKNDGKK